MNLLVTSAGQRVSLVRFFQKELSGYFKEGKVFTTDLKPELAPACHISDGYFEMPGVKEDSYISKLLNLCLDNNIKAVIPTIDTELNVLSTNIDMFRSNNIEIVISDISFVKICRDKREFNKLFISNDLDIPKQYDRNELTFPVFVKPYDGSRSEGIFTAYESKDIKDEHIKDEKLMFMEFISNKDYDEFTVDCYYDKESNLKCVVPRKRILVRAGEVSKGVTKNNIIVEEFNRKLSKLEGARGCLTIQVFLHKNLNIIKGIEINPRFGGGYPLTYLAGANYPRWVIQEYLLNEEIDVLNNWEDNLLMLRYDAEVLISDYTQ